MNNKILYTIAALLMVLVAYKANQNAKQITHTNHQQEVFGKGSSLATAKPATNAATKNANPIKFNAPKMTATKYITAYPQRKIERIDQATKRQFLAQASVFGSAGRKVRQ